MLHLSTQKLIRKLCELTEQGDINWREGDNGETLFDTEGYMVELKGDPPALRILRSDGRELERANPADLASVKWPDGQGSFAEHVLALQAQAGRIARGAEHAISRILSSLSAPPQLPKLELEPEPSPAAPEFEHHDPAAPAFSNSGGPESEAAMAAAVADMALRLKQAPLEEAIAPAPAAAPAVIAANAPQPSPAPAAKDAPAAAPPVRTLQPSAADRSIARSNEIFGRTRSFAVAGRTHHRPAAPEARPVSSIGKITATGLLLTGIHASTRQQPETEPMSALPLEDEVSVQASAPPADARPAPQPAHPDAYKPWA